MNQEEIKAIAKEAAKEALEDLKEDFKAVLDESIVPGVKEAKEAFVEDLKQDAATTGSAWVKVRNYAIIAMVNVMASMATKMADRLLTIEAEKAATATLEA